MTTTISDKISPKDGQLSNDACEAIAQRVHATLTVDSIEEAFVLDWELVRAGYAAGQQAGSTIGFAGLAEKIIRAFPSPITAPEPAWTKAGDALPPCRDEQLFIGVNSAGFAGVFNAVADIAGDVHCMFETAEESISVLSGLALWRPFNLPSLACGLEPSAEQAEPAIRVTRVDLTPEQEVGLRVKNAVSIPGFGESATGTKDRADAERLEWVLRRVSGSWLRAHLGAVGDTGDMAELRRLIDSQRQPARLTTPEMPMLPDWLLNAIGEYGMARTDRVSDVEIQHRWQELIRYIKRYAADCVSATTLPQPNEAKK